MLSSWRPSTHSRNLWIGFMNRWDNATYHQALDPILRASKVIEEHCAGTCRPRTHSELDWMPEHCLDTSTFIVVNIVLLCFEPPDLEHARFFEKLEAFFPKAVKDGRIEFVVGKC